ncbi:hypothetical protein ABPG75_008269 [Micractinium tetrahymenae]
MAEQYSWQTARLVALQLAESAGFDVVQQSCVEILADLLLRFINEAGAGSHHYAELAGRSETNPVDVTLVLNNMGTNIAQLRDFEVPFEATISAFPLRKKSRPPPTFLDRGEAPPPHIPAWLPALPDKHTYKATPVYPGHEQDPQKRQMQLTEQRQQAETALVRLQARLAADSNQLLAAKLPNPEAGEAGPAGAAAEEQQQQQANGGAAGGAAGGHAAAVASNPFLAAPWGDLQSEEQQQQQQSGAAAASPAAGTAGGEQPAAPAGASGPTVEWEETVWAPEGGAAAGGGGGFAQQLFASSHNWKAQQQRKARIATSGRAVREAFGEAYDEQAAVRAGKRQKRAGGITAAAAAAAAANDPTRARVEGILAANKQPAFAAGPGPAAAADEVMMEQI